MFLFILVFLNLAAPAASAAAGPRQESLLRFRYQVKCDPADQRSFPGVVAEVEIGGRRIRAYLLKYVQEQVMHLGAPDPSQVQGMKIRYRKQAGCQLVDVRAETEVADIQDLALRHSPYLVLRPDQASHPERDIPFHLGWSRFPRPNGFAIRYTIYFSNESDHGFFATSKSKSQAIWGRRTDIEWIYEARFNFQGELTGGIYQSGLFLGMGHSTKTFQGRYLAGTRHPVLYDIARHNVFFDHASYPGQSFATAAVHPAALTEIAEPEAREDWMWSHPWSFDLSDRELRRNGTLTYPAQDYLYVRMTGDIGGGGRLEISRPAMMMERISLSHLGEDLWQRSDYTAFRIRQFPVAGTAAGQYVDFARTSHEVRIDALQFLRLMPHPEQGFVSEDVSALFSCDVAGRCRY
jgi:hypothetical protein